MESIVKTEKLTKDFFLGKTQIHALKGVDIEIAKGEFLALAGPSGSGKTTILNLIGGIEMPSSGKIWLDGTDISALHSDRLADIRSEKLGFIFQTFNLIPVLSAFENVEYPLLKKKLKKSERKERVLEALADVQLENFGIHRPDELSGGQRQRVAIARALVTHPLIILADEPTANLDQKTGSEILGLMKQINVSQGATFIFSTHDPKIMAMASRTVQIRDGQVLFSGVGDRRSGKDRRLS